MTMKATQFITAMDSGSFLFPTTICVGKCGQPLSTTTTGRHQTTFGEMCDDDYYRELGELIEAHPIRRVGRRS